MKGIFIGTVYVTRIFFPFSCPGIQRGMPLISCITALSHSGLRPRTIFAPEIDPSQSMMNDTITRPCIPLSLAFFRIFEMSGDVFYQF